MKPGLSCSVCAHPRLADIDASKGTVVRVASRYGVSKSALDRHRKHASKPVAKGDTPSLPPPPTTEREALLDALAKARHGLSKCETEDFPRMLNAMNGITKRLRELDAERDITLEDIARAPAWKALLARFEVALRPYPEAARALAKALTVAA